MKRRRIKIGSDIGWVVGYEHKDGGVMLVEQEYENAQAGPSNSMESLHRQDQEPSRRSRTRSPQQHSLHPLFLLLPFLAPCLATSDPAPSRPYPPPRPETTVGFSKRQSSSSRRREHQHSQRDVAYLTSVSTPTYLL